MIKIDWLRYFRHRVIFGFHLRRKFDITDGPVEWKLGWEWDWQETRAYSKGWYRLRCWAWTAGPND